MPEPDKRGSMGTEAPTGAEMRRLGLVESTPRRIAQACRRAAKDTTLDVACPRVAPAGQGHGIQYAGRLGGKTGPRDGYAIDLSSRSLQRPTDRTQPGHWAVAAASDLEELRGSVVTEHEITNCRFRRQRGLSTPEGPCAPAESIITVAATRVTEYRMPGYPVGGVHGGHLVFMWQGRSAAYLVSVHDPANRERALAITAALIRGTT